ARAQAAVPAEPAGGRGVPARPRPAYAVRTDWGAVGIPLDRPLPASFGPELGPTAADGRRQPGLSGPVGPIWRGLTAVAGRFTSRHQPRRGAVYPLSSARRRAMAAPGAGSVRRYRDQPSWPAEWRSNLPRGLDTHVPSRLLTVGFVLFLAFGGSSALLDRYRHQVARADAALATVNGSLRAIVADPALAASALTAAEAGLVDARGAGADAATVHQQAVAVEAARDLAQGNLRLHGMTRLGALPPEVLAHPVHLARTGRDVWLIGGGLYGIDQANQRLVQVLGPGSAVQGGIVQSPRTGVADGERLLLLDDAALYAHDDTGRWQRFFRGPALDESWLATSPLATYQGSLYALGPGGALLKYTADRLTEAPEPWVSATAFPELLASRDLVIDGRIHVLLADGRILTFFQGVLEASRIPEVTPALVTPAHLAGGPDTNFLYLVDTGAEIGLTTGRLIRLDGAGATRQILPPVPIAGDLASVEAARVLSQVRDLVIDEEAGLIYFVTDTELWRAALPD
ncbi:MAG: hypothetical protein H0V24_17445, partial [Chloroflexia bacterium]|nr:hypothetical protein [Chloroflexia bacterium]